MDQRHRSLTPLIAFAAAALLVTGCSREDARTTGQQVDSAVSSAANKVESASERVEAKLDDAGITASVNAELAKDPGLSALQINVDTANGRVVLRGTAPDAAAKDRATTLASGVKGVNAVDNQLEVRG